MALTNTAADAACLHCGLPVPDGGAPGISGDFCCPGCAAAHGLIRGLGLERYYQRRSLDPDLRPLKPDDEPTAIDYASHVVTADDGATQSLNLMVDGLHCAACVWLIESVLMRQPGVVSARVNMTTRRLRLTWHTGQAEPADVIAPVTQLGYRLVPFDAALLDRESRAKERELLRAMAVAGFAAGNVMLLSVAVWAGHVQGMGPATRDLMHWLSALIALPAIAYAGVPFFRSAGEALSTRRVNMDVPISLAVLLAAAMSLYETMTGGEHAYFDSAVTLLFFLLVGRYLDRRARGRARSAGEQLLGLNATSVTVLDPGGRTMVLPPAKVAPGMRVLAAAGDRIAVDGRIVDGVSDVDGGLVTGESLPVATAPGDTVYAGSRNLTSPLVIEVTAIGEGTLLAEIVRLMEAAEQGRTRYVALADRVARLYAPVVHGLGLAAFLGWWLVGGLVWQEALLIAVAVLIITCPCALALAVPVVQVIASGRLLRGGVLVKSATALERLARVDTVVFDKTGTLTLGRPSLAQTADVSDADWDLASSLAAASRHPLARALARLRPSVAVADGVREVPGAGMVLDTPDGEVRLGSRAFAGPERAPPPAGPELWLRRPGRQPVHFPFVDPPRADTQAVVSALGARGLGLMLLSGDRAEVVEPLARSLGIAEWRAQCTPADKAAALADLGRQGRAVLMVGDGLNDAPALAAASASISPSTAADVSQTAADLVFQGDRLGPVAEALAVARRAEHLVRQNFALAFLYNGITIPLAVAGYVTPLIAAIAMSTSSVAVIANALRLGRRPAAV